MDWLIQHGEVSDRAQGVLLGRELLDQAIIKHGKGFYILRELSTFIAWKCLEILSNLH